MKFTILLLSLLTTSLSAQSLRCSQQKALAKLPDAKLFGFEVADLPLGDKVSFDATSKVVHGTCYFQVFYMFTYDEARPEGWYFPMMVSLDVREATVYEDRLLEGDKVRKIKDGMENFRAVLRNCDCSF